MLCLNVFFSSLSNILQKALYDTGMGLISYQFLSSATTFAINFWVLPSERCWSIQLIQIVCICLAQYLTFNLALLWGEPGILTAILTGITLVQGTVTGYFYFSEKILPVPYTITIILLGVGLLTTTKSGALTFLGAFFIFLSSLSYTCFASYQRARCAVPPLATNFYFRLGVLVLSFPFYVFYDGIKIPTFEQWILLGILGLVNVIYMVCFLQGAKALDVHITMIFTGLRTPVSYVLQFLILFVAPNSMETIGATCIFIAVIGYPATKFLYHQRMCEPQPETPGEFTPLLQTFRVPPLDLSPYILPLPNGNWYGSGSAPSTPKMEPEYLRRCSTV